MGGEGRSNTLCKGKWSGDGKKLSTTYAVVPDCDMRSTSPFSERRPGPIRVRATTAESPGVPSVKWTQEPMVPDERPVSVCNCPPRITRRPTHWASKAISSRFGKSATTCGKSDGPLRPIPFKRLPVPTKVVQVFVLVPTRALLSWGAGMEGLTCGC